MKKIIKGKMYNTETAEMVGSYSKGNLQNDFNAYREELYRKKTGEFFIWGEGNGNTKYASHVESMRTYGNKIIPLTVDESKEWVEKHESVNTYISLFGEVQE